ncbi:S-adenosyl-L-methionine-dependent methyltransferase [Hypoxylon rubiginosum]|uniref:S-adenosyl-L-methionine-dependent methyltransferase n=1 Tax=Hypoxylon rubiginosum TaxID=110542 RepID=A0ACB9YHG2_9PEZI|nr:S-adenosyl-L-methionine-dependent methyltransferase [Hypoxylon rubiginosum]
MLRVYTRAVFPSQRNKYTLRRSSFSIFVPRPRKHANSSNMSAPFLPKQAVKFDGALAQELQGDVSEAIARQVIKIVQPIKPGFIIHDNGCGYGSVTGEIMTSDVPSDIKIHSTDKSPNYLSQLRARLAQNPSWPVEVDVMDSNKSTFPDNYFDLSITDFVLLGLDDELGAAKHILRTLKPGGTAAIAIWKEKPWQAALKEAHRRTRGSDAPLPPFLAVVDYDTEQFKKLLVEAGFKDTQYYEREAWVHMPDLKRWATIAWTFLSTPVGGWKQSDEDEWDEAINICVEELQKGNSHTIKDGVHKIRMIATIGVTEKK